MVKLEYLMLEWWNKNEIIKFVKQESWNFAIKMKNWNRELIIVESNIRVVK